MATTSNGGTTTHFRYESIDTFPEDLIHVEYEMDKKTSQPKRYKKPDQKSWTVEMNGIQFEVNSKIALGLKHLWENRESFCYDPVETLKHCPDSSGYIDSHTGMFVDNPIWELFWRKQDDKLVQLDDETIQKRVRVFAHVLLRCSEESVVKELVNYAIKKKNGMLYKGRLATIAHLNLVNTNGNTYKAVIKNESDTKMTIEVREVGVNSRWIEEPDLLTSTTLFF